MIQSRQAGGDTNLDIGNFLRFCNEGGYQESQLSSQITREDVQFQVMYMYLQDTAADSPERVDKLLELLEPDESRRASLIDDLKYNKYAGWG